MNCIYSSLFATHWCIQRIRGFTTMRYSRLWGCLAVLPLRINLFHQLEAKLFFKTVETLESHIAGCYYMTPCCMMIATELKLVIVGLLHSVAVGRTEKLQIISYWVVLNTMIRELSCYNPLTMFAHQSNAKEVLKSLKVSFQDTCGIHSYERRTTNILKWHCLSIWIACTVNCNIISAISYTLHTVIKHLISQFNEKRLETYLRVTLGILHWVI